MNYLGCHPLKTFMVIQLCVKRIQHVYLSEYEDLSTKKLIL